MRISFRRLIILLIFAALLITLVIYTVVDDSRFVIVRQDVTIPRLPQQFDGYTILQISDLHSQRFGAHEENLAAAINVLDYDLIAVTGDMQKHRVGDMQPFYDLLHAINHKDPILFTAGNAGPMDFDMATGYITEEGKKLQAVGCRLLDRPFVVERDGARIWFSELFDDNHRESWHVRFERKIPDTEMYDLQKYDMAHIAYKKTIDDIFAGISPDDTLIGITHYPVTQKVLDDPAHDGMKPFDLVLAGHYHGGQIRLPVLGAIYIPIPSEPRAGIFPDPRIVSGLYVGNGMQQYVSRGLGAGGPIPFLQFRFLDTPEINLITLHSAAK